MTKPFFTFLFIITSLADYKAVASVNSVHNICGGGGCEGGYPRDIPPSLVWRGLGGLWGYGFRGGYGLGLCFHRNSHSYLC